MKPNIHLGDLIQVKLYTCICINSYSRGEDTLCVGGMLGKVSKVYFQADYVEVCLSKELNPVEWDGFIAVVMAAYGHLRNTWTAYYLEVQTSDLKII